ncbi:zinc finger protein 420-like [Wyeomyia smithii]|uniref:zinc finger protein 420-like n=1 Tax=Wyeomyia smithii TaxID=174621 RepID=UPI002467D365|nr:zinc finger protein 420-like [Wyeomyia smithii]
MNTSEIKENSNGFEEKSFIKVEETCFNEPIDQPNNIHPDPSIDENKPYDCKICGIQLKANNIKRHLRTHSSKKSFDCDECEGKFTRRSSLIRHKLTHSDDGSFGCEICKKRFKEKVVLTQHLKKHERNYKCDVCGRGFLYPYLVKLHARLHSDDPVVRKFKCEICKKEYITRSHLNFHVKKHQKSFACDECPKTFVYFKSLCEHKAVHSNKQANKCKICGKCYPKSYLKAHMRVHAGNQRYKCEVCGKILSSTNGLEIHMKVHRGEQPYKCEICDLSCSGKFSLKTHLRTHTNEDPFGCDVCGKRFAAKGNLKYHMMAVHKNSRPHQCGICGKGFIIGSKLLAHTRLHTGESLKSHWKSSGNSMGNDEK